ncbi:MAG: autotransporter outer membrane beta-barrel domain-containing protein [Rhodospirillales bacterium]|nr:autotransporter outer membrane beta-barrel domain-containing protein [Rhodospirillales bacterium]
MKNSATFAVRPVIGDAGYPGLARRASAGIPFGIAVIVLAVVLGVDGAARAENECGQPEGGTPIVCSSSNYDAGTDGNIVYRPGEANEGDFRIRLVDDLSIRYDRHDPDDDLLAFPVSGDPLYSAVRIETDALHAGDISFLSSADVTSNGRGISVGHYGVSGALRTEIAGGTFSIGSEWPGAVAIHSYRGDAHRAGHGSSGDHDVIVRDVVVDLDGPWGGIVGVQSGEGYLNVAVQDSAIEVDSRWATGIFGGHRGTGDVDMEVRNADIAVRGSGWIGGIYGYHLGSGDTDIVVRNVDIEVRASEYSNGIAYAYWSNDAAGNLSIDARDVDIEIHGHRYVDGIWGGHWGTGDIDVDVRRAAIAISGADSGGMSFIHDSDGDIAVAARNVDIKVEGDRSVGIGAGQRYEGTGEIAIDVRDSTVAAAGESVAGIRSFNFSGEGSIRIDVDGGTITAEGPGSSGILVGLTGRRFEDRPEPVGAPALRVVGADSSEGTRTGTVPQSVIVNGSVWGGSLLHPDEGEPIVGAGIRLYGGGRVEIGPRGSIGASSGVAVRAEGEGAALHVGVALAGRRPGEAVAGEIRNDAGRTTIVVNGTTLHDGMTGATGLRAPHGARDVTLAAKDTIAGRAFSVGDFVTSYAPRAAIYEALPGFLLRLDNRGTAGERLRRPGSPAWVRFSGGRGSYSSGRASVGATYDFDRFAAEAGLDAALSPSGELTGSASLRHVRGTADVSAPTGGGSIEADGIGASVGILWKNDGGYHVAARASVTRLEANLRADGRGRLTPDAGATVHSLGVETGRRFALGRSMYLKPRAWLVRSKVSMSEVGDTAGSRVSLEAVRSVAGLGVVTETTHAWNGGERTLSLRGHLGVERALGDVETAAVVSGERLGSESARMRLVLGLGGTYRWGRWSLGGEVAAAGSGSDDSDYAAGLRFGMRF